MTISIQPSWIPLNKAVRAVWQENGSKPPHPRTSVRWATKGKSGIKLKSRRFNGQYQTTVEAVREFLAAINEAAKPKDVKLDSRRKELELVSAELDSLLTRSA